MRKYCLLIFLSAFVFSAQSQNISGIVNRYYKVLKVDRDNGWVKLSSLDATLATYKKGLLIQMKGVSANITSNSSSFGDITSVNNAGKYEQVNLCGFISDTVYFERKLNNYYTDGELIQLVAIPLYNDVTVTDTLKAQPWDESDGKGGIIAFEVKDTLFLNAPVDASGAGFAGGQLETFPDCVFIFTPVTDYFMPFTTAGNNQGARKGEGILPYVANKECGRGKQVNGGGGGNNHNGGGGGGANYGGGGLGGSRTTGAGNCRSVSGKGEGGLALKTIYDTSSTRMFLGGGGGAGHGNQNSSFGNTGKPGGNGGGIVLISARVIKSNGSGKIMAEGARPYSSNTLSFFGNVHDADSDGGGGAGAGGVINVNCPTYIGNTSISAKGATGSNADIQAIANACDAPGGGGGGGLIILSTASVPAGVTTYIAGGASGLVLDPNSPVCNNTGNGATDGIAGNIFFNYVVPVPRDSTTLCKQVVPVSMILQFEGRQLDGRVLMTATVTDPLMVHEILLQRSFDGIHFTELTKVGNNNNPVYNFQDPFQYRRVFYRLILTNRDGKKYLSQVLQFSGRPSLTASFIHIYPNPVRHSAALFVNVARTQQLQLALYDVTGKLLMTKQVTIFAGENNYNLALPGLPDGLYNVHFLGESFSDTQSFIKTH